MLEELMHSRLLRLLAGLCVLAVSGGIWLSGYFWPWGWVVGGILVLWAIPGGSTGERTRW